MLIKKGSFAGRSITKRITHSVLGRIEATMVLLTKGGHTYDSDFYFRSGGRDLSWDEVAPFFDDLRVQFEAKR